MIHLDVINGSFELLGAFFTWKNALRLYRDKNLEGVYWPTIAFFTMWGMWNIYYYPNLGQWLSFIGGILLISGNLAWTIQAIYYVYKNRKKTDE
jgi:hypothetical protein